MGGGTKNLNQELENKYFEIIKEVDLFLDQSKKKIQINRITIIGTILILIGILVFINPAYFNIKIGLTILLIGSFMVIFGSEKHIKKTAKRLKRKNTPIKEILGKTQVSNRIMLILSIWILFLFTIINETQIELFFILTFIGILVVKELSDEYISSQLKMRMNAYIIVLLMIYTVIISQKIINILAI